MLLSLLPVVSIRPTPSAASIGVANAALVAAVEAGDLVAVDEALANGATPTTQVATQSSGGEMVWRNLSDRAHSRGHPWTFLRELVNREFTVGAGLLDVAIRHRDFEHFNQMLALDLPDLATLRGGSFFNGGFAYPALRQWLASWQAARDRQSLGPWPASDTVSFFAQKHPKAVYDWVRDHSGNWHGSASAAAMKAAIGAGHLRAIDSLAPIYGDNPPRDWVALINHFLGKSDPLPIPTCRRLVRHAARYVEKFELQQWVETCLDPQISPENIIGWARGLHDQRVWKAEHTTVLWFNRLARIHVQYGQGLPGPGFISEMTDMDVNPWLEKKGGIEQLALSIEEMSSHIGDPMVPDPPWSTENAHALALLWQQMLEDSRAPADAKHRSDRAYLLALSSDPDIAQVREQITALGRSSRVKKADQVRPSLPERSRVRP